MSTKMLRYRLYLQLKLCRVTPNKKLRNGLSRHVVPVDRMNENNGIFIIGGIQACLC